MLKWILLLTCLTLAWAAPRTGILVVFDSTQSSSPQLHKSLVELLKQKRAEGHFAGAGVDQSFSVYNLAEPEQANYLKSLGVGRTSKPFISLTQLDPTGKRPVKVTWRYVYASPDEALQALDQQLGLAEETPTANLSKPPPGFENTTVPAGVFSPPGYGFSIELPYPITQKTPFASGMVWTAVGKGQGLVLVAVGNTTTTVETRNQTLESEMTAVVKESGIKEISRQPITHQGLPGLEVIGQYQIYVAQVRVLCSDNHVYELCAINFMNDEEMIQRFFRSLLITQP